MKPEQERIDVRHIDLNQQDTPVKQFFLTLDNDPDGSIIELDGKPVAKVMPITQQDEPVDETQLEAAILARRDTSAALNEEWVAVDQETWEPPARSDQ
jgi:antitoxin (DNA-binding transcriptional repressor) of toxin-antitoxin stability system